MAERHQTGWISAGCLVMKGASDDLLIVLQVATPSAPTPRRRSVPHLVVATLAKLVEVSA
jgi:hypothetical protein